MTQATVGPTLLDLADQVNTTQADISFIFIANSVGYFLGATLGE